MSRYRRGKRLSLGLAPGRYCRGISKLLDIPDSQVRYWPRFWSSAEADALMARCLDLDWDQEHITMFGKTHPVPRMSSWHGDTGASYRYANITMQPKPWVPVLREIRDKIVAEATADHIESTGNRATSNGDTGNHATGATIAFNSVLANLYRTGRDRAAWHADDEPELGPEPVIASVSFGAVRRFRFRRSDPSQRSAEESYSIDLAPGSLLIMSGPTQANWHHEITKTARPVDRRVNLTYRTIVRPS